MKTLSEQINEICQSAKNISEKQTELLKLGLTGADVMRLMHMHGLRGVRTGASEAKITAYSFTFGVEIECYNAPREELAFALLARGIFAEDIRNYGNAHTEDFKSRYKLVPDGSICGSNPVECVTPILKGKAGKDSLQKCCDALSQVGASVNKTTGLHIHIGSKKMTDAWYCNVFVNYMYLESAIDSMMSVSRRDNNAYYAQSLKTFADRLTQAQTQRQVEEALRCSRYFKVNPMSWRRHHTIEFRQHQGSTDYKKIASWIDFLIELMIWSKDNRLNACVNRVEDIPFLKGSLLEYYKGRVAELAR